MSDYYPISVQLENQLCVVIGGGHIAEGKVEGLLAANAHVTLISPELTDRLRVHVDEGRIIHISRCYIPGDLKDAFMVICATNQVDINHQVWLEATANKQLLNVVDDTARCNFIAPSILRQGDLTIAISTGGKAPALAVRLKERLREEIGPQYAQFLKLAGKLRKPLAQHIPNFETRKVLWYRLVDSNVLELLAQGNEVTALQKISEVVGFDFQPD